MDKGVYVLITLQRLFEAINEDDEDDVFKLIFQLGIHDMYPTDAMRFLIRILTYCHDAEYDNTGVVGTLIVSVERSTDETLSVPARLFMDQSIDDNTLRYTCLHLPHVTYVTLMLEFIAYDPDPNLVMVYKRITSIFGPQELGIYNTLLNDAKEEDNQMVVDYLRRLVGELSAPMPKPPWVQNFTVLDTLPDEDGFGNIVYVYNLSLPAHDTAVELLMSGFDCEAGDEGEYNRLRDEKSQLLNNSTVKEQQELLRPFIENKILLDRTDDVRLFRIYGPSNPHINRGLTLDKDPHGGARMLTDNSFNSIDPDFGGYIDHPEWFLGYCQECYQKIPKKCYAIRIPLVMGGFIGCFCSKQCMLKNGDYFDELKDEPSQIQSTMIDIMEQQLMTFGIQDRDYRDLPTKK
jgi:hypothetical protein